MVGTNPNAHRPAAPFPIAEDEMAVLVARHTAVYHERAALWDLLKAQTRNARDLRARLAHWQAEARTSRMETDRLDRDVRAALGAPQVGGSCVEWAAQVRAERDEVARESEMRETELVDVIGERDMAEAERDKALARVTDLETALARAGETR